MQTTSFIHIAQLIQILEQNGINKVVISPGSRNAPLIIGFDSHPQIKTYVIHDERCAAFFAIGLADELQEGVAIVCTSGSAAINYAPAVAEAYYRQVPLLVLTADRPAHLIDQGNGQCIRQNNLFQNFIKASYLLKKENAVNTAQQLVKSLLYAPKGPVHVNIPLEEPLYETKEYSDTTNYKVPAQTTASLSDEEKELIESTWKTSPKKLIIVGQMMSNQRLQILFDVLASDSSVAVLVENTSNLKKFTRFCHAIDRTLAVISPEEAEDFKPDLLLSIGGAVVSKKIKQFFRTNKPKHNWRVGEFLIDEDTYQSKTQSFKLKPELFFEFINSIEYVSDSNFGNKWKSKDFSAYAQHDDLVLKASYSDLKVFDFIIDTLPEGISLQMSNSSVVRYCQLFEPIVSVNYYANRGVSGIDGSTSTAVGMAVANPQRLVVLITGDLSFFYDSNALWNSYLPSNLRICLINNNGGGIFNIIDGPKTSKQNEMFVAPHKAKAKSICEAFDCNYLEVTTFQSLESTIGKFYQEYDNKRPVVMEIKTPSEINGVVLGDYFKALSN